jgi:hypothetical protein
LSETRVGNFIAALTPKQKVCLALLAGGIIAIPVALNNGS